ncbi:unnamed protein product [Vitrella brassicaformis CCMP3155]|uniref:PX domain-containing protein n=1 Tax=Vitrella brassicaformis (strain CCMP3155) TaxID=1169540 RepID=A0A0G4FJS8_VITBC|nr:unnamed protein product [Vitrella brassicaformis CCMP3155]|mmetsp:Transcript_33628/g.83245  ORF Transcript_33628/g.83245 Transcript_33628/m.83245 type:complete len:247 (-) Transcript_33628:172-912(-)|eukprot:CEM13955.1 unnamed protein product [Vitrella brassicaformis CCMP3155]
MRGYSVLFVGNSTRDGHTEYQLKVVDPENTSWFTQKRYREIRELHDQLKLRFPQELQWFPPKRLFNNMDSAFINERQHQLQLYLNKVLQLDPTCSVKVLRKFLEIKPKPEPGRLAYGIESATAHQLLLDRASGQFLDLSQTPQPLDATEAEQKASNYSQVFSRMSQLSVGPHNTLPFQPQFKQANFSAEQMEEQISKPSLAQTDGRVVSDALDELCVILSTNRRIEGLDDIIVPFPPIVVPLSSAS